MRNIALILAPAVALAVAARIIDMYVPAAGAGAFAVALVPAPLMASEVVSRMRGPMDLAGALAHGTIAVSLLFIGGRGTVAAGGLFTATKAFAIAAMVSNGLPRLRDAILMPLRLVGWLAAAVVVAVAITPVPPIDAMTIVTGLVLFIVGALTAVVSATLVGREVIASVAGAGLRDPVLAIAFAMFVTNSQSSSVAIVYGLCCLALTVFVLLLR